MLGHLGQIQPVGIAWKLAETYKEGTDGKT